MDAFLRELTVAAVIASFEIALSEHGSVVLLFVLILLFGLMVYNTCNRRQSSNYKPSSDGCKSEKRWKFHMNLFGVINMVVQYSSTNSPPDKCHDKCSGRTNRRKKRERNRQHRSFPFNGSDRPI